MAFSFTRPLVSIPVRAAGPARPLTPTVAVERSAAAGRGGLPFFVFCVYTFVLIGRPQDYLPALVPFRLALVLSALTLALTLLGNRSATTNPFRQIESKLYLLLILAICVGIPFSFHRRMSFEFLFLLYSSNVLFYFLFVTHVNSLEKFKRVLLVLVCSLLAYTIVVLLRGEFAFGRFYTGIQMFDPNDMAFVELQAFTFALCLLLTSATFFARAVGLTSVVLSLVLALYTGSRGGFLGFATMFLAFVILRLPKVKKAHKVLMLAVTSLAVLVTFDNINVERYLTIGEVTSDYNVSDEFGRTQIWRRGFALFLQNPLTGVGISQFGPAIGTMRLEEGVIPRYQAPHNSYVEILAETGLLGGTAFLLLIATSLRTLNRLRRAKASGSGTRTLDAEPGILLVGFLGQLMAATFLTLAYSLAFSLMFAISASLRQIASKPQPVG